MRRNGVGVSRMVMTGIAVATVAAVPAVAGAQVVTGSGAPMTAPGPISGASADYKVGAGDLLSISVYRSPDLQTTARIATDGTIAFGSLGKIEVANLTASQIAAKLEGELKQRGILVAPAVNVLVSEVRSKMVMVMGAVVRPGEEPIDRPGLTLAAVLARAGASFGTGSGVVTVMEGNQSSARREQFRIADLVSGARDREVRPGEILVVQSAPMIYVSGEVGHPGAFPLEPNMTVGQAIALGGGVTPRGSRNRIRLTRKQPDGTTQEIKKVDFDTAVEPDDLIYVRPRVF